MWNENLVENELADAYFLFLQDVLKEAIAGSCSASSWYSLLPHTVSTSGRWEELSRKIWTKLLHYPVLYSGVTYIKKTCGSECKNLFSPVYSICTRLDLETFQDSYHYIW